MGQFFDELKRRNVFRVAVAYIVASWLVLQVADIVLQGIEAPAWVMKVFMLALALGLPIAVMFAWVFELTPDGLKKEKDVDRSRSVTPDTGRKLNLVTIGMLVAVVVVVFVERTLEPNPPAPSATVSGAAEPEEKSIAVLPFEDLSPNGDQAFFADGLSEELLNVLAKVDELKVAGRTSSFAFKGTSRDLREIGELLNVTHLLEGSVRKSGNRIRVTAQLIKAEDGFHLFSETYDRELEDIFAVQDDIAQRISQSLLTEIVGNEIETAAQTDPQAYEFYLMARQRIHTRDFMALREAATMLDRALEIDPLYAPALAQEAVVTYMLSDGVGAYGDTPVDVALPEAMRLVDQALAIDEDLAEGLAVKGLLLISQNQTAAAVALLERALTLNPTLSNAANWLAVARFGQSRHLEARRLLEGVVERDPTFRSAQANLIFEYARTADFDLAHALIDRVTRIVGDSLDVKEARGFLAVVSGETAKGVPLLAEVLENRPRTGSVRLWYTWGLLALGDFEKAAEVGIPAQRMFALRVIGDEPAASAIADGIDIGKNYATPLLSWVSLYHLAGGEYQELVDRVRLEIGGLDRLFELLAGDLRWGTDYLATLAFAYLQVGDEEGYRRLLDHIRYVLDLQAATDSDNWFYHFSRAQLAALSGDVDGTLEALRAAHAHGIMLANHLEMPMFDGLRDTPGFAEVEAAIDRRIDAERATLGMPPYRGTGEMIRRPSFVN